MQVSWQFMYLDSRHYPSTKETQTPGAQMYRNRSENVPKKASPGFHWHKARYRALSSALVAARKDCRLRFILLSGCLHKIRG